MDDDTSGGGADREGTVPYWTGFDPGSEPVSDAVVRAVSEATGRAAEKLEPINDVVDPIVLDALFRRRNPPTRLDFAFNGNVVTVMSDGEITVRDHDVPLDGEISTKEALSDALGRDIRAAESNGVNVEGAYASPTLTGASHWGIEVFEISRSEESD